MRNDKAVQDLSDTRCEICPYFSDQNTADIELIPEREDTQPDSPLEDTVSFTLKRENSIRRSQRNGRLGHRKVDERKIELVRMNVCK